MYRDDLEAAQARADALERELAETRAGHANDQQRILDLKAELASAQHALQRLGAAVGHGLYAYRPRGSTILVLGVLSLVLCNILGPIAWVMGNEELRRIDAGQVDPMTRNGASAGRVCGIISTIFMIVAVTLGVGLVMLFAMSHGHHGP